MISRHALSTAAVALVVAFTAPLAAESGEQPGNWETVSIEGLQKQDE